MIRIIPGLMVGRLPLSCCKASTVVWWLVAMEYNVSPAWTSWRIGATSLVVAGFDLAFEAFDAAEKVGLIG